MAAASQLDMFLHDAKLIVRGIAGFIAQFKTYRIAGIPADWIMHVLVAAGVFMLAARFTSRRKATILTLGLIVFKEVLDVPVKLVLIQKLPMTVTADTALDVVAGLVGLAAAFLFARKLGDRWRAAEPPHCVEPLPRRPQEDIPALPSRIALACGLAAAVGIMIVFGIGGHLLPHLVAVVLAAGMYFFLGPATALLFLMPALPFADWLHRRVVSDRFHVSTTLILTLLACEAIRRLRRGRRIRIDWPGRIVAVYAACACTVVIINCFRLGWGLDRLYLLIPPVTGLAVYFLAGDFLANPARLRKAVTVLAVSFLVITVIAVIEFFANPIKLKVTPGSVYDTASVLSPYLTLIWPFLLALALSAGAVARRSICWPAVVTGAVVIGLVSIRAGWGAAVAAVALIAAIRAFRRDWTLGVAAVLTIAISITALGWGLYHSVRIGKPKLHFVGEVGSINIGGYLASRGKEIDIGVRLIKGSPILGETGWIDNAHLVNCLPVAHAVTYGLPTFALAAVSILSILAWGWAGALRSRDRLLLGVMTGASAGIVAAAVHGLAWSTFLGTSLQPFVWYTLGVVAAAVRAARTPANVIEEEAGE